jgi:hypothetical protein
LEVLQLQEFAGALLNNATKTALAEELESICTRRAEAQKKKKKKKKKKNTHSTVVVAFVARPIKVAGCKQQLAGSSK